MSKKVIIVLVLVILLLVSGTYIFVKTRPTSSTSENNKVQLETQSKENLKNELKFLKEIAGIKAEKIELINEPVGLKGEFLAPRESILKGVDYFLKDTQNSKMENIEIDIGKGYIDLKTTYNVNSFISTPIEVKVKPTIDKNKNLVLEVSEFRFLDLNIPKWIVNLGVENFVKDWFPKNQDFKVSYDEGKVIIDKSNYDKVILNNITIDTEVMKIDMIINLEKII